MRILVIRNDKLGDFMLAWPALALLKQQLPAAHITVLVPAYTAPMAGLCPWIDEIVIDEGEGAVALARKFRRGRFDALLTLFSTTRVAVAGFLARIPYRLAPATKVAQLFYNQRLTQRRSRSEKPEYAYNLDLSRRLLADHLGSGYLPTREHDGDYLPAQIGRPLLPLAGEHTRTRRELCGQLGLPETARLIFIHPGSGGSATTLSASQYAELANRIECDGCAFVISAGPGEEAVAQQVAGEINGDAAVYSSAGGLAEFTEVLQCAALFISGSTGPLHIAAALDRPTAAFYPRRRSATPLRWQTTNAPHKRLAFTPPQSAVAEDVAACDITAAALEITALLKRLQD